ncbi:MAG: triphosphoribosyl-dephospho-CoA synthase [Candidatus Helarchaeota archaeon]
MNDKLVIKNVEDIVRCSQIAMLLEVSGYPKPGNVHRTYNFPNTKYEHFLIGAIVCGKSLHELVNRSCEIGNEKLKIHELNLGKFVLQGIIDTIRWQKGGNINLGIMLLLYPISAAAGILLKQEKLNTNNLRKKTIEVVKNTTSDDAMNLYKAIEICEPGGLGEIPEFDVTNKLSITKILNENISLYKIFEICKSWDSIASEWTSGFKIIFELGVPYFQKIYNEFNDINTVVVDTYLYLLSRVPDTLIQRKFGKKISEKISAMAKEIIDSGGLRKNMGKILTFDDFLHKNKEKINPGTTADMTAATIFVCLLNALKI